MFPILFLRRRSIYQIYLISYNKGKRIRSIPVGHGIHMKDTATCRFSTSSLTCLLIYFKIKRKTFLDNQRNELQKYIVLIIFYNNSLATN